MPPQLPRGGRRLGGAGAPAAAQAAAVLGWLSQLVGGGGAMTKIATIAGAEAAEGVEGAGCAAAFEVFDGAFAAVAAASGLAVGTRCAVRVAGAWREDGLVVAAVEGAAGWLYDVDVAGDPGMHLLAKPAEDLRPLDGAAAAHALHDGTQGVGGGGAAAEVLEVIDVLPDGNCLFHAVAARRPRALPPALPKQRMVDGWRSPGGGGQVSHALAADGRLPTKTVYAREARRLRRAANDVLCPGGAPSAEEVVLVMATMRLEMSAPILESLNGRCQAFPTGWRRKFHTHRIPPRPALTGGWRPGGRGASRPDHRAAARRGRPRLLRQAPPRRGVGLRR
jgi:hypothetical protein